MPARECARHPRDADAVHARCCSTDNREPYDIEDLARLPDARPTAQKGCGYLASTVLARSAHVIFAPYNYVLDPGIREGMKLTSLLRNAVVIIDEAHNVEDAARWGSADLGSAALREAHTLFAGLADIVRQGRSCCHEGATTPSSPRSSCSVAAKIATRRRTRSIARRPRQRPRHALLRTAPVVARWSRGMTAGRRRRRHPRRSDDPAYAAPATFEVAASWVPGGGAAGGVAQAWGTGGGAHTPPKLAVSELLGTLGVGDESYQQWEVGMKAAEIVVGHLSAMMQQEGQPPHHLLQGAPHHFIFEQVALLCHRLYLVNAHQASYHVVLKQRTGLSPVAAPRGFEYELGCGCSMRRWCSAALQLCHSLVFASGTLEPLEQVAAECGLNVTASTKLAVKEHVVPREQMWLGAVWRDSAQGRAIKAVKKLPDGVPHNIGCPGEYNYRATCTCDWQPVLLGFARRRADAADPRDARRRPCLLSRRTRCSAALRRGAADRHVGASSEDASGSSARPTCKQRDSQAAFTALVEGPSGYKAAVDAPGGGGAMLLAVLRGNLSEGVSLRRCLRAARGDHRDTVGAERRREAQAKMDFNDQRADDLGSGKKYCERLMCRAVNQALGRAIRSKDDYGAVVLIDERHQNRDASVTGWSPPLWARSFYRCHVEFDGPYQGRDLVGHHGQGFADFVAQHELRPFFAANAAAGPT